MLWAHYEVAQEHADGFPQWFCFQRHRGRDGGLYYGFPVMSSAPSGRPQIKVGIDWAPAEMRALRPHDLPRAPSPYLVDLLDAFVRTQLRHVEARVDIRCSPYTMTPDIHFVVDRLHPRLSLFAGGSSHAFKFAPLLGQLLASLALEQDPGHDLSSWRATRPGMIRPNP